MAVQQNTPNAYRAIGGLNTDYINSEFIVGNYGAKSAPDLDPSTKERYGYDLGVMQLMEEFGSTRSVDSIEYQHVEEDFIEQLIVIGTGGITGGANTETGIAVATTTDFTVPVSTQTYYANTASVTSFPVANNMVLDVLGVNALVSDVNQSAGTFTLTSLADVALPVVIENTELPVVGIAKPEKGDAMETMDSRLINYVNNIQTMSMKHEISGSALNTIGYADFQGRRRWYDKSIFNRKRVFQNLCERTLIDGVRTVNTTTTGTELNGVATTEGLNTFVSDNGNRVDFATALDLDDFDDMIDQLVEFSGSTENMFLSANATSRDVDNFLRNSPGMTNGGIVYSAVGGEDKAVSYDFRSFQRNNFTFHKKTLRAFDDPKGLGATDFYKSVGYIIPLGNESYADYGNGNTVSDAPYMNVVYQNTEGSLGNGYEEYGFGGTGNGTKVTDVDSKTVVMRKRFGFEGICPNKFGIFVKTA